MESSGSDESDGSELDEALEDVASEDEEEDEKPAARPYMTLLQSFNDNAAPKAKRRKLEHQASTQRDESPQPEPQDRDDDADVDKVDEEEEDPAIDLEEQLDGGDSDSEDEDVSTDPFDIHFASADELKSAKRIKAVKKEQWVTRRSMMQSWRATLMSAGAEDMLEAPKPVSSLDDLKLKQKLRGTAGKTMAKLDEMQRLLLPLLFDYRDVLFCGRTPNNTEALRKTVCLHALNHVFK